MIGLEQLVFAEMIDEAVVLCQVARFGNCLCEKQPLNDLPVVHSTIVSLSYSPDAS
eukprot:m.190563 g.190563  ORF g.190563 m.190563 type:complete len:56 (-) comp25690_c0_seq3:371-538(-)